MTTMIDRLRLQPDWLREPLWLGQTRPRVGPFLRLSRPLALQGQRHTRPRLLFLPKKQKQLLVGVVAPSFLPKPNCAPCHGCDG